MCRASSMQVLLVIAFIVQPLFGFTQIIEAQSVRHYCTQIKDTITRYRKPIVRGIVIAAGGVCMLHYGMLYLLGQQSAQSSLNSPASEAVTLFAEYIGGTDEADRVILRYAEPADCLGWYNGRLMVASSHQGREGARFWDIERNQYDESPATYEVQRFWPPAIAQLRHDGFIYNALRAFNGRELRLAKAAQEHNVYQQWRLQHHGRITGYAFGPRRSERNSVLLASCTDAGELCIWEIDQHEARLICMRQCMKRFVVSASNGPLEWQTVQWNEDGSLLSLGALDGTVYVLRTNALLADQQWHLANQNRVMEIRHESVEINKY